MRKILTLVLAFTLYAVSVFASCAEDNKTACYTGTTTKTVISCYNDSVNGLHVQWTVDSASDGDTIVLPSGSCTWDTRVYVSGASGKALTFMGQTDMSTIITDNTENSFGQQLFYFTNTSKAFRIAYFVFLEGATPDTNYGFILLAGDGSAPVENWRVDHCSFGTAASPMDLTSGAVSIRSWSYGLVDANSFYRKQTSGSAKHFLNILAWNPTIDASYKDALNHYRMGLSSWNAGPSFGTSSAVYVENNYFYNDTDSVTHATVFDVDYGAKVVSRYNTVINSRFGSHGRDGDNSSTYGHYGIQTAEYYNNSFFSDRAIIYDTIAFRSGTGYVYNNTFTGNYGQSVEMYHYCANNCGTCSYSLLNCPDNSTDYPVLNQVGFVSSGGPDNQTSQPLLIWGNTINSPIPAPLVQDGAGDIIQINRDYCYATGSTMPTTCGEVASPSYSAYTCPHPLTGLTGTCDSAVAGTAGYNIAGAGAVLKNSSTGSGPLNMR